MKLMLQRFHWCSSFLKQLIQHRNRSLVTRPSLVLREGLCPVLPKLLTLAPLPSYSGGWSYTARSPAILDLAAVIATLLNQTFKLSCRGCSFNHMIRLKPSLMYLSLALSVRINSSPLCFQQEDQQKNILNNIIGSLKQQPNIEKIGVHFANIYLGTLYRNLNTVLTGTTKQKTKFTDNTQNAKFSQKQCVDRKFIPVLVPQPFETKLKQKILLIRKAISTKFTKDQPCPTSSINLRVLHF